VSRIEDYALVGDTHTAALVSLAGSIDWCCLPRFDSEACFAALLDDEVGGRWQIAPAGSSSSSRYYRDGTMILETYFETDDGTVELIDLMPVGEETDPDDPRGIESLHMLLRVVCGVEGTDGGDGH
jgi:GH15 family glucan-1,4-alpha-glucosidase